MAVSHVLVSPIADATGTVTIWDGATTASAAATNLVRPGDWNSAHNQLMTITGNTLGSSTVSGTNIVYGATNGLQISASTAVGLATLWFGPAMHSSWGNGPMVASTVQTITNSGSVSTALGLNVPYPVSAAFLRIPVLMTTGSTTVGSTANITIAAELRSTWNAVLYVQGTGASSKSLTSYASGSAGFTWRNNYQVGAASNNQSCTQGYSYAFEGTDTNTTTSYTVNAINIAISSTFWTNFSTARFIDINFANSIAEGEYILVIGHVTATALTTNIAGASVISAGNFRYSQHYGNSQANIAWAGMGAGVSSQSLAMMAGSFSTNATGTTAGFPLTNITTSASHVIPLIMFQRFA